MRLWVIAVILAGCAGSHSLDRPLVTDCAAALEGGQQGDPCSFSGECGNRSADGRTRHAAVCDSGLLLRARVLERSASGAAPCAGVPDEESDALVLYSLAEGPCLTVTFCNETVGGTALRIAEICQIGAAPDPAPGAPHLDCAEAARSGGDGAACSGEFACLADREIAAGEILPVLAWCDRGTLRLAPTQTLIHGTP